MYDVFISYSRKDYVDDNKKIIPGNVVSKVKDLLTANGISFWFDEEGVYSGDEFAPVIARNIKEARIFLFISSKNSNKSDWTSSEIAVAHAYKKKIIPFRCDDSVYNDSVILYIAKLDFIDYFNNEGVSFNRLITSIKTTLSSCSDAYSQYEDGFSAKVSAEFNNLSYCARCRPTMTNVVFFGTCLLFLVFLILSVYIAVKYPSKYDDNYAYILALIPGTISLYRMMVNRLSGFLGVFVSLGLLAFFILDVSVKKEDGRFYLLWDEAIGYPVLYAIFIISWLLLLVFSLMFSKKGVYVYSLWKIDFAQVFQRFGELLYMFLILFALYMLAYI